MITPRVIKESFQVEVELECVIERMEVLCYESTQQINQLSLLRENSRDSRFKYQNNQLNCNNCKNSIIMSKYIS